MHAWQQSGVLCVSQLVGQHQTLSLHCSSCCFVPVCAPATQLSAHLHDSDTHRGVPCCTHTVRVVVASATAPVPCHSSVSASKTTTSLPTTHHSQVSSVPPAACHKSNPHTHTHTQQQQLAKNERVHSLQCRIELAICCHHLSAPHPPLSCSLHPLFTETRLPPTHVPPPAATHSSPSLCA